MELEKKWFYLSATLSSIMGAYIFADLYFKNKKRIKKKEEEIIRRGSQSLSMRKYSGVESFKDFIAERGKKVIKIVFTGGP
jgi:hypothetical protein